MEPELKEKAEKEGDRARETLALALAELRRRELEAAEVVHEVTVTAESAGRAVLLGAGAAALGVAALLLMRSRRRKPRAFLARLPGLRLAGLRL